MVEKYIFCFYLPIQYPCHSILPLKDLQKGGKKEKHNNIFNTTLVNGIASAS